MWMRLEGAGSTARAEASMSNRIHIVIASSDLHLECNLRLARSFTEDLEFSTEDGTRSDPSSSILTEKEGWRMVVH